MSSSMTRVALATLLWTATTILAQGTFNAFVGCHDLTVPPSWAHAGNFPDTGACSNLCRAAGFKYSYWRQYSDDCYCASTPPSAEDIVVGNDASFDNTCADVDGFVGYKVATSYDFQGCQSMDANFDPPEVTEIFFPDGTGAAGFEQCFELCKNYRVTTMEVYYDDTQGGGGAAYNWLTCGCSGTDYVFDPMMYGQTCATSTIGGTAVQFYYAHSYLAASQGLTRRKRQLPQGVCPNKMTACRIQGSAMGFECLDVDSELESCGGCLHGEFNYNNRTMSDMTHSQAGTDCTSLPGVKKGGVTCHSGKCEAYACLPGHKLEDGECNPV